MRGQREGEKERQTEREREREREREKRERERVCERERKGERERERPIRIWDQFNKSERVCWEKTGKIGKSEVSECLIWVKVSEESVPGTN